MTLELRDVPGLPDPDLRPPIVADPGDPFASLRVAHLVARLPRGVPVRLRDMVDRLNADYLDWSFSRPVVAAVVVQLQSNWIADFRTQNGFDLEEGSAGRRADDRGQRAGGAVAGQAGRALRAGMPRTTQRRSPRTRARSPSWPSRPWNGGRG